MKGGHVKYFTVNVSSNDKKYNTDYLVETDSLLTPEEINDLFEPTMVHQLTMDGTLKKFAEDDELAIIDGELSLPIKKKWEEVSPEAYLDSLNDNHVKEVFNLCSLGYPVDSTISINRRFLEDVKDKPQYLSLMGVALSGEVFEDCQEVTFQSNREEVISKSHQSIVENMRRYKRLDGMDIKRGIFITTDISKDDYQKEINSSVISY